MDGWMDGWMCGWWWRGVQQRAGPACAGVQARRAAPGVESRVALGASPGRAVKWQSVKTAERGNGSDEPQGICALRCESAYAPSRAPAHDARPVAPCSAEQQNARVLRASAQAALTLCAQAAGEHAIPTHDASWSSHSLIADAPVLPIPDEPCGPPCGATEAAAPLAPRAAPRSEEPADKAAAGLPSEGPLDGSGDASAARSDARMWA
eukprot:354489-Chlamydomonas_euryale.AAC.6